MSWKRAENGERLKGRLSPCVILRWFKPYLLASVKSMEVLRGGECIINICKAFEKSEKWSNDSHLQWFEYALMVKCISLEDTKYNNPTLVLQFTAFNIYIQHNSLCLACNQQYIVCQVYVQNEKGLPQCYGKLKLTYRPEIIGAVVG